MVLLRYMGPPEKLSEPPDRHEILDQVVLFTPEGRSYRFVKFGEHQGVEPLWALTTVTTEQFQVAWSFGFGSATAEGGGSWVSPGFYTRTSRWTYQLSALRFGEGAKDPLLLPAREVERLRPLVVAELNRRFPEERRGDRLDRLLSEGASRRQWLCAQNVAVLLEGFFGLLAVVAICSMFVRSRSRVATGPARSEPAVASTDQVRVGGAEE
jgi:hypothetical protein